MDKQILDNAIKHLVVRLEKTEKFVLDNAPDICKQMVMEVVINSVTNLICYFIMFGFVSKYLPIFWMCTSQAVKDEAALGYGVLTLACMAVGFFTLAAIIDEIKTFLYVKNCPKLFLLREFKSLIKTKEK